MHLPTVDLVRRDTVRLISTERLKDPVLLPLAANFGALADLASIESATDGRVWAQDRGLPDLDPRELIFGRPKHTLINAAFTQPRHGGNRFNDDDRGAWYCAFEGDTALSEVAYHLTRELEAIARFDNTTDYAELFADFVGSFHDLRGADRDREACLQPDPAIGYAAGQSLAKQLRTQEASNGIVYPSVRKPGGTCLVAFLPDLVQNLRQGGTWRLEWLGTLDPNITRHTR
ncbi:MAG: RES family NAD+ phosphorylase [Pseudomonadota bacterium]